MESEVLSTKNTLKFRDLTQSLIMTGIAGFITSMVDVVKIALESGNFSDFNWKEVLSCAVIAGVSQIIRKFKQDETGKFNII